MDAIVAAGLLEKITENMLLSENGQCYLWTAGMKGKTTDMVSLGVNFGVKKVN